VRLCIAATPRDVPGVAPVSLTDASIYPHFCRPFEPDSSGSQFRDTNTVQVFDHSALELLSLAAQGS
jgi:hypothetical protein